MPEGFRKTGQRRLTDTAIGKVGRDDGFHGDIKEAGDSA